MLFERVGPQIRRQACSAMLKMEAATAGMPLATSRSPRAIKSSRTATTS